MCVYVYVAYVHGHGYLQRIHDDPYAPNITPLIVSTTAHHFRCWNSHTDKYKALFISDMEMCWMDEKLQWAQQAYWTKDTNKTAS